MSIAFTKTWSVDGVFTDADLNGATIGVYDNTTSAQVVAAGTAMTHASTGTYTYSYASPTSGHTYTATFSVTYLGVPYTSQQVIYYAAGSPTSVTPVTSSAQMVTLLQSQLADVAAAKTNALVAISTTLGLGLGPNYSISGRSGSESFSYSEFLNMLAGQAKLFTELERTLLELLQDLQPFNVPRYVGRHGGGLWPRL